MAETTKRRRRRKPDDGEFQDPLKDYSSPDALESTLVEDEVAHIQVAPFACLEPNATVEQVMSRMAELDVACLLIVENDYLLGIVSERDILMHVAEDFESSRHRPVREFMTLDPESVYENDSPAKAMYLMSVKGFRHVPILDVDDHVVGIVGPKRVITYLKRMFDESPAE
ncbi:MAG: hypothetical protein CMJ18_11250 [Phycisphaeraceae bacterium]|nr:hypothetical protein [Phycisphaeraceae bacterium]